jgi:DNA-binding GntR family transcriptional regulator
MGRAAPDDGSKSSSRTRANAEALPGIATGPRFARYLTRVPEHGETVDTVADILREAVLDGVLQPSTWLREKELAQELSVSRTPVREALRRLAAEGLVTIVANQGAMVASMTIEDILEVYAVRENLEGLAARLAARRRSPEDLERLEDALELMRRVIADGRTSELASLNLAFHKVIREASANRLLERFLGQVEHAVRRFGATTFQVPGRAEEAVEEHGRIVEAIAAGDTEEAERLALDHMRRARELRIRMMLER